MNIIELNRALAEYAKSLNLRYDCGSSGPIGAKVVVIAEHPGEREVNMKMPLCGGAGKVLWDALRKYGITRNDVYVTNVIKRLPQEKVHKDEIERYETLLAYELGHLPTANIVVALGESALHATTRLSGITHWRGSVLTNRTIACSGSERLYTIIALNNPATCLHDSKEQVIFRFHIAKLNRVLLGNFREHVIDTRINPGFTDAMEFLDSIHNDAVAGTPITFDIETPNVEVGCIGFANNAHSGMCINLRNLSDNAYSLREECTLIRRMQQLFDDERVRLIAQNGTYDATFLWYKFGIRVRKLWFDTLLAHHTLYPTLPHNLGFLTTQYTDHPYYKDEKDNWREKGDIDAFWRYNVKDCALTYAVHEAELRELQAQKLDEFFFGHVMRANPHLIRATVSGVPADMQMKQELVATLTEDVASKLNEFHRKVHEVLGDPLYCPNPNSPKQMQDLFFTRLRLVGRGLSTDKDNRKLMLAHPRTSDDAKEIIQLVDAYQREHKFLSTYADMQLDDDNRFRCEYKQYGVASAPGRLSSSTTGWNTGGNMQNLPSRIHAMLCAPRGYVFVYFDLSQAEARIVGWKARIQSWIDDFERARAGGDYDCHRALASLMFNVPYDETPSKDEDENGNKTIRFYAKRSRHGFNYRLGPETFSIKNSISLSRSIELHKLYLRINPELERWWSQVTHTVDRERRITNAYGRRLLFMNQVGHDDYQTAIAFYPQSTCGDHVVGTMYLVQEDDAWPHDALIVMNVHDALIALVPEHKAKHCLRIMKRHAERPIDIDGMPLIIPADCKMSVADDDGVHRLSSLKKVEIEV